MPKKILVAEPFLGKEELNNIKKAIVSGWISSKGEFIEKFESEFAKYIGVKYAVSTMNGTAALHLALAALGLKKKDEVIVPDLTYIATANAVLYTGAKPIFVDVEKDTWCVNPIAVEKAVTARTKAIIPVHLYGHPADMDAILRISRKHGLYVIEDAAEAHGAEYQKRKVGSLGDAGAFSFYANKIITTGEGGIITTNNKKLADNLKMLRNQGNSFSKRYWHEVVGYNYRMTNLQAAVGVAQLKKIDFLIDKKRKIFDWYRENLEELNGVLSLNQEKKFAKNVYWMTSIVLNDDSLKDKLMDYLDKKSIETRPFFYPVDELPPYKKNKINNPISDFLAKRGINLPSGTRLEKKDVDYICRQIKSFFAVQQK